MIYTQVNYYLSHMKTISVLLIFFIILSSCKNKTGPDISDINIDLQTIRFERDFFAIDTNNPGNSIQNVYNKYPGFFPDFTQHILGLPPSTDSGGQALNAIRQFLRDYRPVYDS